MMKAIRGSIGQNFRGSMNLSSLSSTRVQSSRPFSSSKMTTTYINQPMANTAPPILESEEEQNSQFGITNYVGPHNKPWAIMKERFADFQVHEIDNEGRIIELTDIGPPRASMKLKPYLHFTLYKEGTAHTSAVKHLRKCLKIGMGDITFSGIKDRHAQTTQRFCVSSDNVTVDQLMDLSNTSLSTKYGNYSFSTTPLKSGYLQGNHFKIFLKNVQMDMNDVITSAKTPELQSSIVTDHVDDAMRNLKGLGFINYFGLQRMSVNSHQIAIAVLKEQWNQAFDLILSPWPGDPDYLVEAKKIWLEERDPEKAMKFIPPGDVRDQILLLKALATHYKHGNGDMVSIFKEIPVESRKFYFMAFSSYYWNLMVNYRLETFGFVPIYGDYIFVDPPIPVKYKSPNGVLFTTNYKRLTKDDLHKGHLYTMNQILLPMLGSSIQRYPHPDMQKYYEKLLADIGLDMKKLLTLRKLWGIDDRGSQRFILTKPQLVKHEIVSYYDFDDFSKIMPSDVQLLMDSGRMPRDSRLMSNEREMWKPHLENLPKKNGVIVEFALPSGCYAHMVIREIMNTINFKCWGEKENYYKRAKEMRS